MAKESPSETAEFGEPLCEHDARAKLPTDAVRESAKVVARQVVLEIARVEMILSH